jgi:hypothetical protein
MERIGRSVEAEAKLAAEEERRIEAEKEQQCNAEGRKKPGEPAAPPSDQPDPKAQRNFTDPESRIMKSKEGFVQAYNAQAAVDADTQIIVAHELTQCGSDQGQLVPLVEAIENNLGRKPERASADSGYCSEPNLEALVARGIDGYVAPGRAKHPAAANGTAPKQAITRFCAGSADFAGRQSLTHAPGTEPGGRKSTSQIFERRTISSGSARLWS